MPAEWQRLCISKRVVEVGLQTPPKQQKLEGKVIENLISSSDGLWNVQKQGRDERTQKDYPTDGGKKDKKTIHLTSAA